MYKRYIILLLAINMSSLYAILGGVGISGVSDGITIPEKIYTSEIEGIYEVTRDSIDTRVGVGGFAYLTIIPFIDLGSTENFIFIEDWICLSNKYSIFCSNLDLIRFPNTPNKHFS